MTSRTTLDYETMAQAGIAAIVEPSFWLGQPRTHVGTFEDYFNGLLGWERFRASQFGIQHYCCIGLNSKEANNEALAEAVMEILPAFAAKERVVAIGEIGFDEQTALEEKYFRLQLDLARQLDLGPVDAQLYVVGLLTVGYVSLGTALARLHRTTAKAFGWPRGNTIGTTPQDNAWTDDWARFFRDRRIAPQLALAARNGRSARLQPDGHRLLAASATNQNALFSSCFLTMTLSLTQRMTRLTLPSSILAVRR